jgi:K+-transporting ATPase ATPase C chain
MLTHLRPALTLFVALSVITGGVYPALVTGIGQVFFAKEAAGSLIVKDNKVVGSSLIGQPFADPKNFWSRASATSPYPYNAASSTGSNLGPTNSALMDAVAARIKALKEADPQNPLPIPVDLVTSSASGLDPHISPASAEYQVARVARARSLTVEKVRALVAQHTEGRQFGFLGEPRVNVLELNLALDEVKP